MIALYLSSIARYRSSLLSPSLFMCSISFFSLAISRSLSWIVISLCVIVFSLSWVSCFCYASSFFNLLISSFSYCMASDWLLPEDFSIIISLSFSEWGLEGGSQIITGDNRIKTLNLLLQLINNLAHLGNFHVSCQ